MRRPLASEFFIVGVEGLELTEQEQRFFTEQPVGGVILFKRNIEDLAQVIALNSALLSVSRDAPPIISVDQEGGRVARLRGICTDVPPLAALAPACTADPHLAYRIAAMQARELVSLGFHLNFAPVCDVMNHAQNEVIGDRAFSSDPDVVAKLCSEYIRGLQGAGLAACAKHFPGHGATSVDSHLALPVIDTDIATLHLRELKPFIAAILADVATIMTAHIITKPLDALPATMSDITLTKLLREQLGFSNVIISDDLTMKAVADNYSLREVLERSFLAGVDLFIIGNDAPLTREAIGILDELIRGSDLMKQRARAAADRIAVLRSRYVGKPALPDQKLAEHIVRSSPHLELVKAYR